MADPLLGAGLGAGSGLLKSLVYDIPRNAADRERNAAIIKYSPWTHMQPGQTHSADTFGNMTGGAMQGLIFSAINKGLLGGTAGQSGGWAKAAASGAPAMEAGGGVASAMPASESLMAPALQEMPPAGGAALPGNGPQIQDSGAPSMDSAAFPNTAMNNKGIGTWDTLLKRRWG